MTRASCILLLALLPLGLLGCDDAPTCNVLVTLDGGISGDLSWPLEGTDSCGLADPSAVAEDASALVFLARSGGTYQQFIILVDSPELGAATFPGRVLFLTPDDLWDSGAAACTVVLTEYTVEPWSLVDFVQFEGVVDCPGPLVSIAGDEDIALTTMGISGHIHDQQLSFENI